MADKTIMFIPFSDMNEEEREKLQRRTEFYIGLDYSSDKVNMVTVNGQVEGFIASVAVRPRTFYWIPASEKSKIVDCPRNIYGDVAETRFRDFRAAFKNDMLFRAVDDLLTNRW